MPTAHLAIDLGASSGRAIVGVLSGDPLRLELEEVHRFEHHSCPTPQGPVWDLTGIWRNVLEGLSNAGSWCRENKVELKSVGVDTWGVDWVAVGAGGELLGLPHCYRDPQNEPAAERAVEKLGGFDKLYARTGIQRMPFNTIFQLAARHAGEPRLLETASRVLFLPDLLHYWLSGEMATERSIASTSSLLDVNTGEWDRGLLDELGVPSDILGPIAEPGTDIGALRPELAEAAGVDASLRVIMPAAHDTASAVAAAPASGDGDWAYLSSGTWSLLGVETQTPILTDAAREAPLTHERGVDGTIRFLRNIAGLWLVQELRRELSDGGGEVGFGELVDQARAAEPYRTLIDPNHSEFASPGNVVAKLQGFASRTNQPAPESPGQLVRCCLEGLALSYRQTLDSLETILGRRVGVLHIVGGGTQNTLLNELTASAIGRTTTAGPVEATAIGNLLVQAMGSGEVDGLAGLREVVRSSFDIQRIEPAELTPDSVYHCYQSIVSA